MGNKTPTKINKPPRRRRAVGDATSRPRFIHRRPRAARTDHFFLRGACFHSSICCPPLRTGTDAPPRKTISTKRAAATRFFAAP